MYQQNVAHFKNAKDSYYYYLSLGHIKFSTEMKI